MGRFIGWQRGNVRTRRQERVGDKPSNGPPKACRLASLYPKLTPYLHDRLSDIYGSPSPPSNARIPLLRQYVSSSLLPCPSNRGGSALATLCNIAALIFCCKNWLGMRHRPQLIVNVSQTSSQPSFHGPRDQGFDHQNNQRRDKRSSSAQDRPSDSEKSYLLRDS